jgi:hypothetical protein
MFIVDAFLIFAVLAIGLALLVLLMKRSAAQKGAHRRGVVTPIKINQQRP